MNFKKEESLLANVKTAPRDAILGLTETYVADPNPKKVNLGVGVYYDDQGKVPLLECVRRADESLTAAGIARPYLAMDGFPEFVRAAPKGWVALLPACCHNPTGVDIRGEQWKDVIKVIGERRLIPFLDFAYQGFGEGVDEDAEVARGFARELPLVLVAMSFSKSFSLYGERVGSLSVVTADSGEAARVLSNLKRMIRTNYSNPPSHGARIVASVLASSELSALWRKEVLVMRDRVRSMRRELVERLKKRIPDDFGFILQQRGIFSYSGLSREQMVAMRERYSVYGIESGRICVAALNPRNLDYVADAIAATIALSAAERSKPRPAA